MGEGGASYSLEALVEREVVVVGVVGEETMAEGRELLLEVRPHQFKIITHLLALRVNSVFILNRLQLF